MPSLQDDLKSLNDKLSDYRDKLFKETDPNKRASFQRSIDRLQQEIVDIGAKIQAQPTSHFAANPTINQGKTGDETFNEEREQRKQERLKLRKAVKKAALPGQPGPKHFPAIEALDKHFQEAKKGAQKLIADEPARQERLKAIEARKQASKVSSVAKDVLKDISTAPKKTVGQAKSSSEKLADIALKEALKAQQQARNPQIPRIAKDTATEIVIASIVAIFLIQAGAGTKFAELWSLAFSPTKKGKGVGDYTGQGPGGLPNESWELPTSFHGLIA